MTIDGAGHAVLTQEGKTLGFRVLEPAGAVVKLYPTDPPPAATDAPNPGTRRVGFEVAVGAVARSASWCNSCHGTSGRMLRRCGHWRSGKRQRSRLPA